MGYGYDRQGDEQVFCDDFPGCGPLLLGYIEAEEAEQGESPDHADNYRRGQREQKDGHHKGEGEDELGQESGDGGFPDLLCGMSVFRFLGNVNAQGIREGIGYGYGEDAADDHEFGMGAGVQAHNQAERRDYARSQAEAEARF